MEAAAEVLEPGSSVHVYAAHTQVRTWHYPESLSRRIKSVRYLRIATFPRPDLQALDGIARRAGRGWPSL